MPNSEIIADMPLCFNCGHDKTITQEAWEKTHTGEDLSLFASAQKSGIPLTAQSMNATLAMPFVKTLIIHEDFCAKCGAPRAIRAEIMTLPTSDIKKMTQQLKRPQT